MPYYRKKPVVIEAEPLTEGCYDRMTALFGEEPGNTYGYIVGTVTQEGKAPTPVFEMWIKTLEGDMWALPGDYIIKGVKGEFYPCKPDIFEMTYEEVPHG